MGLIIGTKKHVEYPISWPDLKIPAPGGKQVLCPRETTPGITKAPKMCLAGEWKKVTCGSQNCQPAL